MHESLYSSGREVLHIISTQSPQICYMPHSSARETGKWSPAGDPVSRDGLCEHPASLCHTGRLPTAWLYKAGMKASGMGSGWAQNRCLKGEILFIPSPPSTWYYSAKLDLSLLSINWIRPPVLFTGRCFWCPSHPLATCRIWVYQPNSQLEAPASGWLDGVL